MSADFQAWLHLVGGGEDGARPAGADRVLREVFDRRGPLSAEDLEAEINTVATDLVRSAVWLVIKDLHATTPARPRVDVHQDPEYGLIVAYNGGYSTPSMFSLQHPEATREIADYLQGEIVDDLWTVWPTCREHGGGLDARTSEGQAVWQCRLGDHRVAMIGELTP